MKPARHIKLVKAKSWRNYVNRTESEELATNVDIEELAKNVEKPDDAAELIKKMDKMIKVKKSNIFDDSLPAR